MWQGLHVVGSDDVGSGRAIETLLNPSMIGLSQRIEGTDAVYLDAVLVQLLETGDTPDTGRHPVVFEDLLGAAGFADDAAAGEQVRVGGFLGACGSEFPQQIKPLEDALFGASRHVRHRIALILDGQIVDHVILLLVHSTDAPADADGEFVALVSSNGFTIIDSLSFGPQTADVSYGRISDGSTSWGETTPTPNSSNGN